MAERVDGEFDAAIIMECSELKRTGVEGLDRFFVINIDHHPGNADYGAINWFDGSAAACGEMVFDVIRALDVPLSVEIATHIYLGILTDTGSFHYSSISPRTFDICRQLVEAGVDPPQVARSIFDSNTLGRLKLFGAVLSSIELEHDGRLAVVYVDRAMAAAAGGTYDDTEGLINLPLTVREIQAVVFFKEIDEARLPREHALEGRHRPRRGGQEVRRRRPQERVRLQRDRPLRRGAGARRRARSPRRSSRAPAGAGAIARPDDATASRCGRRRARHRQAAGTLRRTTSSRRCGGCWAAPRSGTPARSIPSRPAFFRCSSAAPPGSRSSSQARRRRTRRSVQFGWATDTYDSAGEPIGPTTPVAVDRARARCACSSVSAARSPSNRRRTRPRRSADTGPTRSRAPRAR